MKVAVSLNTKTIIDLFPDKATSENPYLINNWYIMLDIENPISNYIEKEDGTIEAVFRELLDEELLPFALKEKKELRTLLVANIEVEYNGMVYQGDEISQDRMK